MAVSPGSTAAAEQLISQLAAYRPKFLAFVRARASDADAEDLLQQSLTRAYEKAHTLRDRGQAVSWFYRILRRTIADFHTRRAVREGKLATLAAQLTPMPDEDLAVCACGLGLLSSLSDSYQQMLRRVDLDDEPLADVAASLNITRNNATVRLHRARTALRERLLALCGAHTARDCMQCSCES